MQTVPRQNSKARDPPAARFFPPAFTLLAQTYCYFDYDKIRTADTQSVPRLVYAQSRDLGREWN
jgi:hypothetical protein